MARSRQHGREGKQNKEKKKEMRELKKKMKAERKAKGERGDYSATVKENELFERYYKGIGMVPENEWEEFMNALKQPLPITFRITGFKGEAQELLKIVKGKYLNDLSKSASEEDDDEEEKCSVQQLPWYPNELGWQINLTRKEVRQDVRLQKLKEFLVNETESGNISRQEAVSMIPPLVADIKPHHKVLDMCAAPGSKTAQLIEYLHSGNPNATPEGYVIANDKDNKRCYLMTHQVKRLQTPCCAVINHDASILPNIAEGEGHLDFVKYDRVLCDVPCSGDGTLRKNLEIWERWNINQGIALHTVQSKIVKRGLELLKVGGRLVYSTCSFNPVENEAVVSHILRMCEGSVELVDASDKLPGLKFIPGLQTWKVFVKENNEWKFITTEEEGKGKQHLKPTIYPPPLEVAEKIGLKKCMRVLPHHQNSGGFFIAVLEKKSDLPWMSKAKDGWAVLTLTSEPEQSNSSKEANQSKKRKMEESQQSGPPAKQKFQGYKEDPFLFMTGDDPLWPSLREYFGIPTTFPYDQVMYRTETGKRRSLYFVSSPLRNIVLKNRDRIKFVNLGVRMLMRSPSPLVPQCDFRICQEAKNLLSFAFPSRVVLMPRDDMKTLLAGDSPFLDRFSKDCKDNLNSIVPGSIIFWYKPSESEPEPASEIIVCGWRGKSSTKAFLGHPERTHYLRLFGVDFEEYLKNKKQEQEDREQREGISDDIPDFPEEKEEEATTSAEGKPDEDDLLD